LASGGEHVSKTYSYGNWGYSKFYSILGITLLIFISGGMTMNLDAKRERILSGMMGVAVADAAALGLHWIYDIKQIKDVGGDAPEFIDPDQKNYHGVPSYFAHPEKKSR
jgi:hypothetical protein